MAERFQEHRRHLRSVAYRVLGSFTEADDPLQDASIRANRAGPGDVENIGGWLTTIVARVCLNMLRARNCFAGRIVAIDAIADPDRVRRIAASRIEPV